MQIVLILIVLIIGLTVVFPKVAEWFQEIKNINIIPATLLDMIAGIVFVLCYGSVWMCVAIVVVLVIIAFNLSKYGIKNGALASLAELVFSIAAALIICIFIAKDAGSKPKRTKKRK